jgi:predicted aspartyl protease
MKQLLGVFALLIGFAPHTVRADCPPLTLITSVKMFIGDDNRAYVPVEVDNSPKYLLIDTGGAFTMMQSQVAAEMKLEPHHSIGQMIDVEGGASDLVVSTSMTLGRLHSDRMDFAIFPTDHVFPSAPNEVAGIFGANLLHAYDLDLDFGNNTMNLISQNHCDGKVVYWPADSVAVVPITLDATDHIIVPVVIDGQREEAMLDTGASDTVINQDRAVADLGLKLGSPDTPVTSEKLGGLPTYTHRFQTLSLEGLTIRNPTLAVIPDRMKLRFLDPHDSLEGDTRIRTSRSPPGLGDMILGMDVLRKLHIYIAYKEKKLYITPAASQATPVPVAASTSSAH